jgi:pimeloyl-ACP methyl ester carboxylesterase
MENLMNRSLSGIILVILLCSCEFENTPKIVGSWLGDLIVNENVKMQIGVSITFENDSLIAQMASIDQGVYGIEVNSIIILGDSITLEVAQMGATYKGIFKTDTTINGQFVQGERPPLVLNLSKVESIPGAPPERHQIPEKPYPYLEEEIEFTSAISGLTLAGTLTKPKKGKDFPAVVLITGSGANDRDETIWGHKVFLVLADHLTRNGIVVLRLDDRGVGGSTGDFSTASISDFADDAIAGVEYLKNRTDLDISTIGLIGHSLGADIAPLAANRNKNVEFVTLMAGSGITLAETIHMQTEHIYSQRGASQKAIDLNRKINQTVFDIGKMEIDRATMEAELEKEFKKLDVQLAQISEQDKQLAELPKVLKPEDYFGLLSDNMRFDLSYNPSDELTQLSVPVLILAGDLDTQVSAEHNVPLMQSALNKAGNDHVTINIFPNVNHLFQTCETGEIEEYNQIGETIALIVLDTISDWIGSLD